MNVACSSIAPRGLPRAGTAFLGVEFGPMPEALSDELIRDFIRRLTDGFNNRDTRLIEEILGDHLIDHSELLGRMDLRQRLHRVQQAFPDARYEAIDYLVQGHAVAWRWTLRGTHPNEVMGVQPTGRE